MPAKKYCPIIVVEKELLKSKAWLSLGGKATQVYLLFLTRRIMENPGKKSHKRTPVCTNAKKLIFTYSEAKNKFGLTKRKFGGAIDALIDKGFIDIIKQGGTLSQSVSEYGISERWKKYGTKDFKETHRKKRMVEVGFCLKKK